MAESQALTVLGDDIYDDPSQLSQALRQRACSDKSFHFTTSPESHLSANRLSTFTALQPPDRASALYTPVVLAATKHAPSPRRATTANYVKPALPKHHSAPNFTSTGVIDAVQGAFKMHHSFNGMDAPGDTQPDSQMFKQFTSGIYTSGGNHFGNPKSLFFEHREEDCDDPPTDGMDIVESSQEPRDRTITSPTVVDIDEQGDYAPDSVRDSLAPTSPLKFQTPALAARKRASSGQHPSSAARTSTTPGTAASASMFFPAFDNGGTGSVQHISLTQAFNNTQAPTSPVVGAPSEDVVFTRPSPNFTHMRHSSPIPAFSSPIKATQPDTPKSDPVVRSSSVPRAHYVTMKQSQDSRKQSVGGDEVDVAEQDSWQELSRQVRAKKAREDFHREAASAWSHISAPIPVSSRPGRKRTVNTEHSSHLKSKTLPSGVHNGPEGEDDLMDDFSQPGIVKERADELSQNALTTARTVHEHNSSGNRVQVPKTSSYPHRTQSGQPSRESSELANMQPHLQEPASQPLSRGTFRPPSSKDSFAIMDSQPEATASIPPPKSLRFPSSPSINQYSINQTTMTTKTGYTSQIVSSSIPPMPPVSSPDDNVTPEEEARVPSSPPLLTHEEDQDDLEYDEHTYDEQSEKASDREETEPPAVDEDTVMEDDDDLPTAKEETEDEVNSKGSKREDDDLHLVQPAKEDLGTDNEVPETLEQEQSEDDFADEARSHHGETERLQPPQPPRIQRQNTIPETDALDETQPSFFPDDMPLEMAEDNTTTADNTNNTGAFQTAQEEPFRSLVYKLAPHSSRTNESDTIRGGNRIHSVDDIYNLPETQQSTTEEDFEMPRLSGLEDDEEGVFPSGPPPAQPSAKRRKLTYTAKRKVFRSSPKTGIDSGSLSDPPSSPRLQQVQQVLEDSPPTASAREREEQGALAVSHVREEAQIPYRRTTSLKSKILPKSSRPQNSRNGALKPVSRELLQSLSSPATSKTSVRGRSRTPRTPTKPREVVPEKPTDVEMADANEEPQEPVSSAPPPTNVERLLESLSQRSSTPNEDVIVPNRVFAAWPGSHYYPATCIGRSTTRQLQIRYDDGNITSMDAVHVRALDLRTGDHVKVDETGMKKNTYVVVGFKDRLDDLDGEEFPTTDRRGHTTVVLEERPRESLPKAKAFQPAEHISVPMARLYLTAGLWKRLRDRSFNFSPPISPDRATEHVGTPVADLHTTPSFSRRGTAVPSFLKDATTRAASVASTTRSGSGVFANMAFVLTSTAADLDKETMAKVIKANGGQILEQGFHELFEYAESAEVPTPSQSRRRSVSAVEGSVGLALKHAYKDLGFVALLSDSHSRSTKYIQALALNVPCLHLRWIQDSLATSRAAPFTRYLLPAGVSKFLDPNGVVRSRTMTVYDPASDDVSFSETTKQRDLLLRNQSVLLVTGKSKKEIEKRQPFIFLSHALGSANVGRCPDLAAATDMLKSGAWDWVYVDNGERGLGDAAAELFGTRKPAAAGSSSTAKTKKGGKKRKRDGAEEEREELLVRGLVEGRLVRVTGAEFVVQSLILGALVEV